MGFFTHFECDFRLLRTTSQSLSGWDGVFHYFKFSNSFSRLSMVAIPFRVGWGFSQELVVRYKARELLVVAIPFRVGWGFSLFLEKGWLIMYNVAIPFRVGWGFSRSGSGTAIFLP